MKGKNNSMTITFKNGINSEVVNFNTELYLKESLNRFNSILNNEKLVEEDFYPDFKPSDNMNVNFDIESIEIIKELNEKSYIPLDIRVLLKSNKHKIEEMLNEISKEEGSIKITAKIKSTNCYEIKVSIKNVNATKFEFPCHSYEQLYISTGFALAIFNLIRIITDNIYKR